MHTILKVVFLKQTAFFSLKSYDKEDIFKKSNVAMFEKGGMHLAVLT